MISDTPAINPVPDRSASSIAILEKMTRKGISFALKRSISHLGQSKRLIAKMSGFAEVIGSHPDRSTPLTEVSVFAKIIV
jgi:hypothetical protein